MPRSVCSVPNLHTGWENTLMMMTSAAGMTYDMLVTMISCFYSASCAKSTVGTE